jgi:IclR family transcriptional regulator, mhp operon transcriptional activator
VRGLDVPQEVNRSGRNLCRRSRPVAASCAADRLRLRDTLEELGYTVRSSSDERFRVTRRVSNLGNGYDPSVIAAMRAQ